MHVVLFVLLVAVFAVFLFGLLFPMLKRMQKEVSTGWAAACACTLTQGAVAMRSRLLPR